MNEVTHKENEVKRFMAKEYLGERFLDADKIKKFLICEFPEESLSLIPFSMDEIMKAQRLNLCLVLRTDKLADGTPITIQNLCKFVCCSSDQIKEIKKVFGSYGYFNEQTPRRGWALISRLSLDETFHTGWPERIEVLLKLLLKSTDSSVYNELTKCYKEAIVELNKEKYFLLEKYCKNMKKEMKDVIKFEKLVEYEKMYQMESWAKISSKIGMLKIMQLITPTPVEILYDSMVWYLASGKVRGDRFFCTYTPEGIVHISYQGEAGLYMQIAPPSNDAMGFARVI